MTKQRSEQRRKVIYGTVAQHQEINALRANKRKLMQQLFPALER